MAERNIFRIKMLLVSGNTLKLNGASSLLQETFQMTKKDLLKVTGFTNVKNHEKMNPT